MTHVCFLKPVPTFGRHAADYHASSPTDRVILELQMYGRRPHQDEPDPLPDKTVIGAGLAGIVETFAGILGDTSPEPDLDDLLRSFLRAAERVTHNLDRHEEA
ncbi:hypothetical protein [Mesorhizobium sp. L-8-3]|uniref:hypothetical protein n=1 Tax=Mesorhizobium sp. L-8-3 TaxID=2744522 RepID=UPI00406CBD1E